MDSSIRTMELVGIDDWHRPVYKCIETNVLYKDIELGNFETPSLYSCGNNFEGEPGFPIKEDLKIIFKNKYKPHPKTFEYQLLARLKADCDYYLGFGNRSTNRLWADNEREQIEKMKELYNDFPADEKPEWLTWEQILQYEKEMVQ